MGVHGSIVTGAPPLSSFCSFITSEKTVIGGSTPLSGNWEMKIDVSPRMKIRSQRLKPRIRVQSLKPTIETPNQMVNFLTVDLNFTFRDETVVHTFLSTPCIVIAASLNNRHHPSGAL